jgi:uncharacterized membrane protein YciS (DUF1049 family)
LLYFLYKFDLVLHAIKDYPLLLDHISLDILIEHFTKIIKMWDLSLWSQLFCFLHKFDLIFDTVRNYPILLYSVLLFTQLHGVDFIFIIFLVSKIYFFFFWQTCKIYILKSTRRVKKITNAKRDKTLTTNKSLQH